MNSKHIVSILTLRACLLVCTFGFLTALHAQPTEKVLYTFSEAAPKGIEPNGTLVGDGAGNLYGTTEQGGQSNQGFIFKVDNTGRETVLYSFTGGTDGAQPNGGLVRDAQGNLYGTTYAGGLATSPSGVVFEFSSTGTYSVVYSFTGGTDGGGSTAGVALGANGVLYWNRGIRGRQAQL